MAEDFEFMRGIVKKRDIEQLKIDMRDAIKGVEMVKYLDREEPVLMSEARKYAEEETQAFEGTVGLDTLPFLQFAITRAVLHGFLIHKKANDRFWKGIDSNSKI